MKRRVCVVTGARADYGNLHWVMRGIAEAPDLELQVVAAGMHLSPEYGLTYRLIEADGFRIDAKVPMLVSGDTAVSVAKSIGLGTAGFADAFEELRPDLILVLGDRFEILAAAQAALVARIPMAHIAGGDTTEGAYDEAIRHSVTKMSHVHFVTNADAGRRVRQLGEDPAHIHNVGSPGLDAIAKLERLDRAVVEERLGFRFRRVNLLVTFHPATLSLRPSEEQMEELVAALRALGSDTGFVFTRPNADNDGRAISRMIDEFVAACAGRAVVHAALGQALYLNAMAQADAVVGNSSSGLYEAPSFAKPTVNIGERQRGRLRAESVVDCAAERGAIGSAIQRALAMDCSRVVNPYGDGHSAPRIVAALQALKDPRNLLQKRFHAYRESP